jgi:uncharacterized membrane protein
MPNYKISTNTQTHIQKTQQTDTLVLTNIYENTFLLLLQENSVNPAYTEPDRHLLIRRYLH